MSGLSCALQAGQQNGGRLAFQFKGCCRLPHELRQLFVGDFDEQLTGLDGGEHLSSQRLFFDCLDEILRRFEVDIGIEQGLSNFFQGVANIDFRDRAVSFQHFEGALKPFLEIFKHAEL